MSSLPACPRLHPTHPSVIELNLVHKANGTTYQRRICTTCRSAIASAQSRNGRVFGAQGAPVKKAYGVRVLGWAVPEMLVSDEVTHGT